MSGMRRAFPSTPEAVAEAVRAVEATARASGLPDEVLDRVALATGEAVANAVEHGNAADAARSFTVSWDADAADGYWLRVEDEGEGLEAGRIEEAELPEDPLSTSGRGLFLIRTLSDEVRLEAGGRRIAMRFARREGA